MPSTVPLDSPRVPAPPPDTASTLLGRALRRVALGVSLVVGIACVLGALVCTAQALLAAPASSAANLAQGDALQASHQEEAPAPSSDQGDPSSEPSDSSRSGEELPESQDAEVVIEDGRRFTGPLRVTKRGDGCAVPAPAGVLELVSQCDPDGLERPPRA